MTQALALHHTEPTPYMQLRLPVDPLVNDTHCEQISASLMSLCSDWERRVATESLYKQLPAKRGLYMFVWRPKLELRFAEDPARTVSPPYILYVGQAGGNASSNNTIRSRYQGEYAGYVGASPEVLWDSRPPVGRKEKLRRFLSLCPLEYWYCTIEDQSQILRLESRLNYMLSPPLVSQGRATLVETDAFTPPKPKKKDS